jgi:hypothetical protein
MKARAARRAWREVERRGGVSGCGTGAALKHVDQGRVVDQWPAMHRKRLIVALLNRELRGESRIDVGLVDRDPVDQMFVVLLHGTQRRAAAIRHAGGDHDGVALVDFDALARKLLVQHLECEPDRAQHIFAPVLFRILLRVSVLEGESIGGCGIECRPFAVRDRRREV